MSFLSGLETGVPMKNGDLFWISTRNGDSNTRPANQDSNEALSDNDFSEAAGELEISPLGAMVATILAKANIALVR